MATIRATKARQNLYTLIDEVAQTHEPIEISGKRSSAVLVAEEDWRAIQETLYLLSAPGMRDSLVEGMKTDVDECAEKPGW